MADAIVDSGSGDGELMFGFAHDLRGHLRTILTRIQLVQVNNYASLPESDAMFLEEAANAAINMESLIGAMVSYFDVAPAAEVMGLSILLRGILIEMKGTLEERQATVTVTNDLDRAVPRALHTVIKELITNSCRFRDSERTPEIRIATTINSAGELEVSVSDNGSGVGPDRLEKMFLPFRRMHSRTDYPGFGLGLAYCRKIVRAYNGSISASLPSDKGLKVTVTIPVA
jgi:two-component system, sensor histidine kinase and response regulator